MTTDFLSLPELKNKLGALLNYLYPQTDTDALTQQCLDAIGPRINGAIVPPE